MMKLRKFELVFVVITLAFLFFIGGFFTGRNFNQVNLDSFDSLQVATSSGSDIVSSNAQSQSNDSGSPAFGGGAVVSDSGAGASTGIDSTVAENVTPSHDMSSNPENAGQPDVPPGMPRGGDGRININAASKNELMDLPGIGPSLADRIIEYRNSNGAFATIEDIMNVSGIAEGRFARIKDRITV